jgi:hypothetical protein
VFVLESRSNRIQWGIHYVFAHSGVDLTSADLESLFYRAHLVRRSCKEALGRVEDAVVAPCLTRMIEHHELSMFFYGVRR